MAEGKANDHGSALNKALSVLELITAQSQAIGLPDLTAKLGLPRQTVHRILIQLEEQGLIIRDASRDRFYVGPKLTRLAINALFSENHNLPTRVILRELVDSIQESCNIGVLDGMDFVYLDRIEADWTLRVHSEAGHHVPAYCTSGGKLLLAYLPEKMRNTLIPLKSLKKYTATTITDGARLEAELKRIHKRGYATNDQEFTSGIVGVALPILDPSGRAIAAIACHAPVARMSLADLKAHIPKIRASAEALGRYWG
ncbi:MAG: IclR family transcriptional regulator [Rhodospirillales bacterium]|nr:IclR family transcriptional regulator [Rhodospirillales bacterium]